MKLQLKTIIAVIITIISLSCQAEVIQKNYSNRFIVWLDNTKGGAIAFQYKPIPDTGNFKRHNNFSIDSTIPSGYQATNAKSFGRKFDRGHLAPINQFDDNVEVMSQSNYMTNILPQTTQLNRTGWLKTEMIIECLRDSDDLMVYGGAIYSDTPNKFTNQFMKSHGVQTPLAFYKIIVDSTNKRSIAWLFPNDSTISNEIDRFIVSIAEINRATGFHYTGYGNQVLTVSEKVSWIIPKGCDRG